MGGENGTPWWWCLWGKLCRSSMEFCYYSHCRKATEWKFFVPAQTLIGVKLLMSHLAIYILSSLLAIAKAWMICRKECPSWFIAPAGTDFVVWLLMEGNNSVGLRLIANNRSRMDQNGHDLCGTIASGEILSCLADCLLCCSTSLTHIDLGQMFWLHQLGWEIHSEFRRILRLIQFRTFWTPEFSSESYFSNPKMCSRQFWTQFSGSESSPTSILPISWIGKRSRHQYFFGPPWKYPLVCFSSYTLRYIILWM